ncbi:Hsp20/alpha crystallin family protein [Flagellimonas halotolerans]|uniref:Hsp20/alpha crystallin family protein n=1 Tax=Flagellimonas halotolerans TaxID=3112164 RepID=A0ABU6IQJ9_9FLAO|nr:MULTISPECIES: Hsp20/alpha crystallin family protein [unclassified Allomuricauda]MEC3965516.1 Hsp20/alpha crystallin family protein [Muricauda sp. SYSU M86414]MEC4265382.1 Hsp20/alpha crystallin family protein [Muricauda sp. SYSU M84420]
MKVFGREIGKVTQFPPILIWLKKWTKRVTGIGKLRPMAMPSMSSSIGETDFGLSIPKPVFGKDNVKMELQGNTLIISGEKKQYREVRKRNGARREFARASFHKTLDLPQDIAPESIHATLENGLLQVRFSKRKTIYRRLLKVA